MNMLDVHGLSVSYGGVHALSDVAFTVEPGQLLGLIGPNGAGKTTLIDAVSGYTKSLGTVRLGEKVLNGKAPHARARLGLSRTWQLGELFDDLTVRENLSVAAARPSILRTARDILRGRSDDEPLVEQTLERLGLTAMGSRSAGALTEGQRKLVGVGRALVSNPRVVMLDEPAAGLDPAESAALGKTLREVVDAGLAMLLVDHDMGLVMSICDKIVVIEFGRVIASGTPEEIRRNPAVIQAYLGASSPLMEGS